MYPERKVFFNTDENGITLLSVGLYSLLKTADPTKRLWIFIAHNQEFADLGYVERLRAIVAKFDFAEIAFGNLTPVLEQYPDTFNVVKFKAMMWGFPLCEKILPPDLTGNIVYLDMDIVVRKDLEELYSLDLRGRGMLAASVDESERGELPHLLAAKDWPEAAGRGFNNAIQVVDLDAFRAGHYTDRIIAWREKHRKEFFTDQDAQNVVYGERTLRIPVKWNYTDGWLERVPKLNPFAKRWRVFPPRDVLEAILDPCIIHYIGQRKPTSWTHRPERKVYRRYMNELGLLENDVLPGETRARRVVALFFDGYHALLRAYVRLLFFWYNRANERDSGISQGHRHSGSRG